jgi:hypothetical protein
MIRELHIYDFDATLFMSPMHPDDWEGHIGSWYDTLQSLTPPCVVDPSGMWINSTVSDAMESIGNPEVYTVLMTGRGASPELSARVEELIAGAGLSFDEVHLKPGGGTAPWKSSMMEQFIAGMPDLEVVQVWDDRSNHLETFVKMIEGLGLEAIPHFVNQVLDAPCDIDADVVIESALRSYIREMLLEVNEYGWDKADRKTMGQDGKAKGRQKKNWVGQNTNDVIVNWYKDMGLAEALLLEDPMGFVQDLAKASDKMDPEGEHFYGGEIGKAGGKAIKDAFRVNADHEWLSTLDTVHWAKDIYSLAHLPGSGKDELSATMTPPGEGWLRPLGDYKFGLWIKGRITLAANDQDALYSGHMYDYMPGLTSDVTDEEYEQQKKSSGINKRPTMSKDFSRYGMLKPGSEFGERMARSIPYVVDQSTWDPSQSRSGGNEALVDNWNAVGVIAVSAEWEERVIEWGEAGDTVEAPGKIGEIFRVASEFGVPIYNTAREELWSPE